MARVLLVLALLCSVARADGAYVSWSLTGWFPRDKLATKLANTDNGAQFALIAGMRIHDVAIEAWHSSPMHSGIAVTGLDAKLLVPLGRYVSPYARVRLARMTVDLDPTSDHDAPLTGLGGGGAIGVQVQFPGRTFGLVIPAWFAAPFGWKGTGGIYVEFGHETYGLATAGERPSAERFWRFAYGVAWGGSF